MTTLGGPLPRRIFFGWGLGSFPMSILSVSAGVLLLRFMTDTIGIAAYAASMIFAVSKIWDAVNHPLMGALSDRLSTPWGRRLPMLLTGGLLSALVILAMFAIPTMSPRASTAYMFVMLILFATAHAMFVVAYIAMFAEMTQDYEERTRLSSCRVFFSTAASLLALGIAPMLLDHWGAGRAGYRNLAIGLMVLAAPSLVLCAWLVRGAPRTEAAPGRAPPLMTQLRTAAGNRPFLWLMSAKLMYFLLLAFQLGSLPYFTKHALKASDTWLGLVLTVQSVAVVAVQPLWILLARRIGKKACFMVAAALYALVALSWWLAVPGEPGPLLLARAVATGLTAGGMFLFSQAMLPDAIEHDYLQTGLRREGVFTGVYALIEQVAASVGIAVLGVLLGATGYVASTTGGHAQPAGAVEGIRAAQALVPALFAVLTIAFLAPYDLNEGRLRDLRQRRAALDPQADGASMG